MSPARGGTGKGIFIDSNMNPKINPPAIVIEIVDALISVLVSSYVSIIVPLRLSYGQVSCCPVLMHPPFVFF